MRLEDIVMNVFVIHNLKAQCVHVLGNKPARKAVSGKTGLLYDFEEKHRF